MRKSNWVSASVVCDQLGISPDHLARLRKEGMLKLNKHYRDVSRPRAVRRTYRYHLKRCETAIELPVEVRG